MRKIRHFCLTLNYPLSNVSAGICMYVHFFWFFWWFSYWGKVKPTKYEKEIIRLHVITGLYMYTLMKVYCSIPYKRTYYKFGCLRADISMQSWIPMEMTQCLKNDYEEGCSLDRKQKTSKKEKLSKEKWFISLFCLQRFCEKIVWLPGVSMIFYFKLDLWWGFREFELKSK